MPPGDDIEARIARHRAEAIAIADECAHGAVEMERMAATAPTARARVMARERAKELREREREVRGRAGEVEDEADARGLRDRLHSASVDSGMHVAHRITRSAAASDDPFVTTINDAGYTMRSLAKRLDISPTLLSFHRSGVRPIPEKRAERIEKLTGWPAGSWPSKTL